MVGQIYPFPSWLGHKDFSSTGVLRLELDKESYQRSGLQGQPVPSGGRKHVKARYRMFGWGVCFWRVNLTTAVIEIELRKPSMLHGKKGFERLIYAAKNVLNQSMVWLFCDLNSNKGPDGSSAIGKHHPTTMEGDPMVSNFQHVLTPPFSQVFSDFGAATVSDTVKAEAAYEITEWLGLVVLQSPRVLRGDNIDSYLSGYVVPEGSVQVSSVRIINWQGLIGARWVTDMLNRCM